MYLSIRWNFIRPHRCSMHTTAQWKRANLIASIHSVIVFEKRSHWSYFCHWYKSMLILLLLPLVWFAMPIEIQFRIKIDSNLRIWRFWTTKFWRIWTTNDLFFRLKERALWKKKSEFALYFCWTSSFDWLWHKKNQTKPNDLFPTS